ncbi:ABC transporter ATP-binding protein [Jeotgalibaca arthritidis]|uniref:ABC transporter ATP-binding protein n=1 Tax=Jeotgalibaca arthritidis TaxID=1868794 RepID=A0A6G7K9S2_9LACT|nr:ABC transporter ATP-binding protein [Jeotgalibaca arthritidis]QII82008.1 ABC transporter ATP-binding protein [Jeotgalibaca arthritidis]
MISVKGLSKTFYGQLALNDINFSIAKGEIFGFLGPSGAGKTTTINILTGQLLADSGQVIMFDKEVGHLQASDFERVGIVSDTSGYYEKLSLYKNILLYAKLFGVKKQEVDEILKRVDLYASKDKPAEKLSTGMKQRMLLARAIINKPDVLFLDEPTSGLDPTTSKRIHELLLELKSSGTSIFLTTHDMNEATFLCDRLVLLNQGELIESGTPQEIIHRNNHVKALKIAFIDGSSVKIPFENLTSYISRDDIFSIHSCEPTLEDIFIKLTGVRLDAQ